MMLRSEQTEVTGPPDWSAGAKGTPDFASVCSPLIRSRTPRSCCASYAVCRVCSRALCLWPLGCQSRSQAPVMVRCQRASRWKPVKAEAKHGAALIGHGPAHPMPVSRPRGLVIRWEAGVGPTPAPRVQPPLELGVRPPLRPLKASLLWFPNPLPERQGLGAGFGQPVRCLPRLMLDATQSGQQGFLVRERLKFSNRWIRVPRPARDKCLRQVWWSS